MPAAAVIPAPIVYIKVVAVKTLVVGRWGAGRGARRLGSAAGPFRGWVNYPRVTVRKLECSKQAYAWIG